METRLVSREMPGWQRERQIPYPTTYPGREGARHSKAISPEWKGDRATCSSGPCDGLCRAPLPVMLILAPPGRRGGMVTAIALRVRGRADLVGEVPLRWRLAGPLSSLRQARSVRRRGARVPPSHSFSRSAATLTEACPSAVSDACCSRDETENVPVSPWRGDKRVDGGWDRRW